MSPPPCVSTLPITIFFVCSPRASPCWRRIATGVRTTTSPKSLGQRLGIVPAMFPPSNPESKEKREMIRNDGAIGNAILQEGDVCGGISRQDGNVIVLEVGKQAGTHEHL